MDKILSEIRNCTICKEFLPYEPRPIIQASDRSKILVIGQAPGLKVQKSGIPWDDASGNNLREWLGVDKQTFYDDRIFALVPMGFCFPGSGKSGDLPPRPEWLIRQLKIRERGSGGRVVQGEDIGRPGIFDARGRYGADGHSGQAADNCGPHQGVMPLAGPDEKKVGAARFRSDLPLAVARKQKFGDDKRMAPRRAISIDVGARLRLADRIAVDLDLASTDRQAQAIALFLQNHDARLTRLWRPELLRHAGEISPAPRDTS